MSLDVNESRTYVVDPPPITAIPVVTTSTATTTAIATTTTVYFPVRRVYAVAKNYADHIREMGDTTPPSTQTGLPWIFLKPTDAVVPAVVATDATSEAITIPATITKIPYPVNTTNLHYEIELVIAIGKVPSLPVMVATVSTSPQDESQQQHQQQQQRHAALMDCIYGYAVGVDLTRRDWQTRCKQVGGPWDVSKGFDRSAPISAIRPIESIRKHHFLQRNSQDHHYQHHHHHYIDDDNNKNNNDNDHCKTRIWLQVNDQIKQDGYIENMLWSIPAILDTLHHQHPFALQPGDLIFTGTPSGVGPLQVGDVVTGGIDGLERIAFTIV